MLNHRRDLFILFCFCNKIGFLKAAVRNFFSINNDPKSIFEQVHNQPVLKTIALL